MPRSRDPSRARRARWTIRPARLRAAVDVVRPACAQRGNERVRAVYRAVGRAVGVDSEEQVGAGAVRDPRPRDVSHRDSCGAGSGHDDVDTGTLEQGAQPQRDPQVEDGLAQPVTMPVAPPPSLILRVLDPGPIGSVSRFACSSWPGSMTTTAARRPPMLPSRRTRARRTGARQPQPWRPSSGRSSLHHPIVARALAFARLQFDCQASDFGPPGTSAEQEGLGARRMSRRGAAHRRIRGYRSSAGTPAAPAARAAGRGRRRRTCRPRVPGCP